MVEYMNNKSESSSSSEVADADGENIVPKMVLRVLLVESDDSTRRLIAALLRKCGYKVVAVSDGLKAWETVKARPHNIDLILTEVNLPSISGYALLTLIMEHDICKSIPVIMISSQDSISVVLRCMLKGAADFLTKPIRRNELRNLWQHVWRRQNKTEQRVLQSTTAAKHKVDASCENTMVKDSKMSCGDRKEESVQLIVKSVLPTCEIGGKPSRSGPEVVSREETYKSTVSSLEEDPTCSRSITSGTSECSQSDREHDNSIGEIYGLNKPSSAVDYISKFEDYPENVNGCYSLKSGEGKLSLAPYLELSLRKPYPNGSKDEETIEEHRLNHSNGSAFSWYDNSKTLQSLLPAMGGNCGDAAVLSGSQEDLITTVVSRYGQAEAAVPGSQLGLIPLAGLSLDTLWPNYIPHELCTKSDLAPTSSQNSNGRCDLSCLPLNWSLHSGSENQNDRTMISDHTVQEDDNISGPTNGERDSPFLDLSAASGSYCGAVDKLNSSVCGSICSTVDNSNFNPSAAVTKSVGTGSLSYSHTLVREGVTCMDSHSASQREAALQKFRLKRKDRCFDKKVRYQSRKRLAEQRPRVKGQFVRQVQAEALVADC